MYNIIQQPNGMQQPLSHRGVPCPFPNLISIALLPQLLPSKFSTVFCNSSHFKKIQLPALQANKSLVLTRFKKFVTESTVETSPTPTSVLLKVSTF